MTKLAEVCLTEESRGIAIFDVKIAYLPLTEITIEHEVIIEKDGRVCDMGTNRVVIKDQKGEHVFIKDLSSNRLKGVGRGRKANSVYDTLDTALDMVDTEMLLGSFDSEIFELFYVTEETQETSNTETINTTTTETEEEVTETEEVTTSNITERSHKHKGNPSSNTDQNCSLEEKILTANSLDDSVTILYNALVKSRNDDLMENVFSLTELKYMLECQGLTQDEVSQTLNPLTENANTSYFIDVEGCNFRPITETDLLDIIQKLHTNSQQKYIRKGSRYYETKVYEC